MEKEPHALGVAAIICCHILDVLPDVYADRLGGRGLGAQKVLKMPIPVSDVGVQ